MPRTWVMSPILQLQLLTLRTGCMKASHLTGRPSPAWKVKLLRGEQQSANLDPRLSMMVGGCMGDREVCDRWTPLVLSSSVFQTWVRTDAVRPRTTLSPSAVVQRTLAAHEVRHQRSTSLPTGLFTTAAMAPRSPFVGLYTAVVECTLHILRHKTSLPETHQALV